MLENDSVGKLMKIKEKRKNSFMIKQQKYSHGGEGIQLEKRLIIYLVVFEVDLVFMFSQRVNDLSYLYNYSTRYPTNKFI